MSRRPDRFRAAGGILSYFTHHSTAANIVLLIFIAAGIAALPRMRAQYFPDVVIQEIAVAINWQGAGAADVDRGIVQLLEPALIAVEGVVNVNSNAREGRANIRLEFEPGWDMGRASDEVTAAVASVGNLPESADDPTITRRAWRDRVTDIVISGPVGAERLTVLADEFLARLYQAGVNRASIQGLAGPRIDIELPLRELIRHGLSLSTIARIVAAEADADPAGDISGGGARLRTGQERRSPESLSGIVLKTGTDGSVLTLGDVARITETGGSDVHAYFVGDNPAVLLRAERSADGDALDIQDRVKTIVEEITPTLPAGVTVDLIRNRTDDIRARLDILLQNGAMGLALVVGLLFLFLNARTAFWVAAGIPVAMLAAIALMYAFGITINMISLFALILTLGIVVDDAIVIGEHTDFRVRQLGEAPYEAAESAVRRMAAPVFSSTATTVIAFLGLMAISGRFGDLIADIPFTVTVVLTASLLESFIILPNHMAHALSKAGRGRWYDAPSRVMNRALGWFRDRAVRPVTRFTTFARYPVLAAAVLLLSWGVGLLVKGDVAWRFFNSPEEATISGNFAMLEGATRTDSLAYMKALQKSVDEVSAEFNAKYGGRAVTHVLTEIGANTWPELAAAEFREPDQLGSISVQLSDPDLRPWRSPEFVSALQNAAPTHPMLGELSYRSWRRGPGGDALDIELSGTDPADLKAAAEAVKRALIPYPEVSGLDDTLPLDKDELVLALTPQGHVLGFTIEGLGAELRDRLSGVEAATFPDGPRTATIRVKLPDGEVTSDFLDRMVMTTPSGGQVPLGDLVTVTTETGFSTIRRENGQQVVSVTGDIDDSDATRLTEIESALQESILPDIASKYSVGFKVSGLSQQEDQFLNDAIIGFAAALLGIFVVLAWIFASWTRPLVVMAVIPLGLIGAVYGHHVWGIPMSMFSVVGLIGMAGIIINDAIVLIATIDEYAQTRGLRDAVVDAVADRLRPVFLTTATTVLGLAPLLYEGSRQAEFLKPTVVTLCFGLGFGFVLVLVVVPALVMVQADVARLFTSLRRMLHARNRPLRRVTLAAIAFLAASFALTMGPALIGTRPATEALGEFVLAAGMVLALLWGLVAVRLRRRQPAQP
jgi:multidrug efflux pump subunit AcrB